MFISPEDVAYAMGYRDCFFEQDGNKDLCEFDDWFTRGDIDFNFHNYSGPWQIDAYEVVNGVTITDHYVCVWKETD
jgi:hypothetical protein